MGPCTMNIGNAKDPRVAITLHPKNLVMEDGSAVKASRCMAVRNFVKIGTKSTPRTIASLKSNWVRRRPKDAWHIFTSVSTRKGDIIANACKSKACTNQCFETVFSLKLPSKKTHIWGPYGMPSTKKKKTLGCKIEKQWTAITKSRLEYSI